MVIWDGLLIKCMKVKKFYCQKWRPKYCQKVRVLLLMCSSLEVLLLLTISTNNTHCNFELRQTGCCTWQPDMTPSPPAQIMVSRAKLPHHWGVEHTACSTTSMGASCRMAGTLPPSVKTNSECIYVSMACVDIQNIYCMCESTYSPSFPSQWCNKRSHEALSHQDREIQQFPQSHCRTHHQPVSWWQYHF